ncbi:MAG: hypothetical protein ACK4VP_00225 [Nitrospira sp.]
MEGKVPLSTRQVLSMVDTPNVGRVAAASAKDLLRAYGPPAQATAWRW